MPETFEAYGVPVRLVLGESELEPHVFEILPPGWRACAPTGSAARFGLRRVGADVYEVQVFDQVWLGSAPLDMALDALDAQIRLYIAANANDWTFVHAGAVALDGRALLIPGQSFSGKSTLVKALVEAGATYYSDEYAVLDDHGRVHPYPRRLSLRGAGRTEERDVSELGGVSGDGEADVALVALTRYSPGHGWQPSRLSPGQGVPAVLANTVPAQERPGKSLRAVSRALSGAVVLQGTRGEAEPVAAALLEELRG